MKIVFHFSFSDENSQKKFKKNSCRKHSSRDVFSCMRKIENWLLNSIVMDLLAIIGMHGYPTLLSKTDTCNA